MKSIQKDQNKKQQTKILWRTLVSRISMQARIGVQGDFLFKTRLKDLRSNASEVKN